jgi:hypothetical protein
MSAPASKLPTSKRMKLRGSLALLFIFALVPALAEKNAPQTPSVVGDAPANAPPFAKDLSPRLKRKDIEKLCRIHGRTISGSWFALPGRHAGHEQEL